MSDGSFTGRTRKRTTSRGVRIAERVSRLFITAGGIGTIVAVSLIFFFLLWVVLPLFLDPSVEGQRDVPASLGSSLVRVGVDPEGRLAWTLDDAGVVRTMRLDTGDQAGEALRLEETPRAASFAPGSDSVLFGFEDGRVQRGTIRFVSEFPGLQDALPEWKQLAQGELAAAGAGIVERTPLGQLRRTVLEADFEAPLDTGFEAPIVALDHSITPSGPAFAALLENGSLHVVKVRERKNLMTGKVENKLTKTTVSLDQVSAHGAPMRVLLAGLGEALYLAWPDGRVAHFDLRDFAQPRLAEVVDVVEDARLECLEFLVGKTTLLAGDSLGNLHAWFPVRDPIVESEIRLGRAHELGAAGAPVVALSPSARSRLVAVAYADGRIGLFHVTSRQRLLELKAGSAPDFVALTPKEDGVVAFGPEGVRVWEIDVRYPEASLGALFRPVWYEGYASAEHVWQSAGGTDEFEPKLGLTPLVFGTLKATFYSMIIGAPLALLAAMFSSEFLSRRLRGVFKSTIELMASLPSVVLGFLAALVIAPFVQSLLPAVLAALLTIPFALLLGAYLWQLLPPRISVRLGGSPRFLLIAFSVPLAILLARLLGPLVDRLLFAGDVEAWLAGGAGSGTGGWFYLLLPLAGLVVAWIAGKWVTPRLARARATRARTARLDLIKFAGGAVVAVAIALFLAAALSGLGLDPRASVVGTYVPRNAMIVGFVMGFAIVPIIYTLAEDALSEVPGHLREASLGAGATPWQTAVRVVIPTATSGIFSALMIGLGRAVGETMIVLMAVGNTAIMDWNVFNGFRTLSANIAVELPEAVRGSTHYRTLFLAALVLFSMTFLLNTVAEMVRRHFRKRTSAL